MKNKYYRIIIIIFTGTIFFCCKKKQEAPESILSSSQPSSTGNTFGSISGFVQKGPFLIGTSLTIYELNQNLSQTGKSFLTQINSNLGDFQLNNISLISNFAQIKADGFYFNEVCGSNSLAQISLNCITNLLDTNSVNVNLLTHLEKPRVEYLLSTGLPFDSAKTKALKEILNIFYFPNNITQHSENLDISKSGNANAILLAISAILQGYRTESELSVLLATISNDIKVDGLLNDNSIKSSIIDHAIYLDTVRIRNNINNYYNSLGINATVPHFEYYISQFINNCGYAITNSAISYPPYGQHGNNILDKNQTLYYGSDFSFKGQLKKCMQLKIRIHKISGSTTYGWEGGTNHNLSITNYDFTNNEQFFTVIDPNLPFDLHLVFPSGTFLIEYFEKDFNTPTYSKTITTN